MNKNMIIILGGALFVAILAALLVQSGLSSKEKVAVVEQKKIQILVASKNIDIGVQVGSANLAWKEWPEGTEFPGAIIREGNKEARNALKGRALRSLEAGEPITRSSVVKETRGNFVAASLTAGKRGFAIPVTAATAAGGFVSPGDYVDIILTHEVRIPNDDRAQQVTASIIGESAAETIVRGVKVLAIDQESSPSEEATKLRTVTLEVTPEESEVLALGNAIGDLSLSLRKLGEDVVGADENKYRPATTDNRVSPVIKEVLKAIDDPNTAGTQVRLYSGNQSQNISVRNPNP